MKENFFVNFNYNNFCTYRIICLIQIVKKYIDYDTMDYKKKTFVFLESLCKV
jgi:hypothetical protein